MVNIRKEGIGNFPIRFVRHRKLLSQEDIEIHKVIRNGVTYFDDTVNIGWQLNYSAVLIQADPITYQYTAVVKVNSPFRNDGFACPNVPLRISITPFGSLVPTRVLSENTPYEAVVATGYATYRPLAGQFDFTGDGRITTDISYLYKELQPLPPAPPEREWVTLSDFLFNSYPAPYILEPQDTISFYDNYRFH